METKLVRVFFFILSPLALRTQLCSGKFKDDWGRIYSYFDSIVSSLFEKQAGTKRKFAMNFVRENHGALSLFIGQNTLDHLIDCVENCRDPDITMLQNALNGSACARVIFADLARQSDWVVFKTRASEALKNLLDNNFDETEMNSFKQLMNKEAKRLIDNGHERFSVRECEVSFMTATVKRQCRGIRKVYETMLAAQTKMIALNSGQLPMLPWEAALFPVGGIPGIPSTVRVPEHLLKKSRNCRDAALKIVGASSGQLPTLSECKRGVNANIKMLLQYDEEFALEAAVLNQSAEHLFQTKLEAEIMAALPTEKNSKQFQQAPISFTPVSHF